MVWYECDSFRLAVVVLSLSLSLSVCVLVCVRVRVRVSVGVVVARSGRAPCFVVPLTSKLRVCTHSSKYKYTSFMAL